MLVGAGTVCGCAYYNGLYNANQLVKDAVRAEREGRAGEAQSLWSRAAVKAESVAVRYTESSYHDDALLLRGRALRAAGQCGAALEPLRAAIATSSDGALVESAHFLRGRCQLTLGMVDSAIASFSRALPSDDIVLASEAHLWRGRAYAATGAYRAAIVDFSASSLVDAAFDLAVAHARLGQPAAAGRVLQWRVDGQFSESLWLAALDSVGGEFPDLAAAVVERLIEHPGLSQVEKGRLLLQDGDRWAVRGYAAEAAARYEEVVGVAPGSAVAQGARFRRVVAELQSTDDLERLPALLDDLTGMIDVSGPMLPSVAELSAVVETAVESLRQSRGDDSPADDWRRQNPDLEIFLAAESLRDKAEAELLAAALFEEVVSRYPNSPVAPKALLAAAVLDPSVTDSLVASVRRRYPLSPYALVLTGGGREAYAALEDSLRTLILARRGEP